MKIDGIATNLYHSILMHGFAIAGVLGQLEQGLGCGLVDRAVLWLKVAHQVGHSPSRSEGLSVVVPVTAMANGLSQVATEPVIGLCGREQDAIGPKRLVFTT